MARFSAGTASLQRPCSPKAMARAGFNAELVPSAELLFGAWAQSGATNSKLAKQKEVAALFVFLDIRV
ncbi:MAG: hypothetical protein WAK48_30555 [Candidatus Acidiferrum sp.]